MRYYDEDDDLEIVSGKSWIYIGCDVNKLNWSKVGKTTEGLHTRHRSSQNPDYCIYTAFEIIRGDVHDIEKKLLKHLESECSLQRLPHMSTSNDSECFRLNPDNMTWLVEQFINKNFWSCVTYENSLHGEMSRYRCDDIIYQHFQTLNDPKSQPLTLQPLSLGKGSYFTGNQEVYEIDLGDGYYIDAASGMTMHRDDEL
ncbi:MULTISPECIES: hypothetical protein [unclassified Pseudomonas]|uniref:hypothetical protein n=1 Tax=unclassified Pseudomonas TaxID=196821 RepID=UPI001C7F7650|nr:MULTISPECIES: hypothetical protein [unclassified Pseudomonas]